MVAGEIFQTDGVLAGNQPLHIDPHRYGISVYLWNIVLTDFSAIDVLCYVGINSSGKKACTFHPLV